MRNPLAIDGVNTTSHSTNWSKHLSPFFCGPVELYGDFEARNVENGWQYSKCYPEHVDEDQNPSKEYWKWAKRGWDDNFAHRYPMGKGAKPLYAYWDGEKLGYIEARKKIYAPLYAKAVEKTKAWQKLKQQYEEDGEIILVDFDGYNHRALGMTYSEVVNNENKTMGHSFILAMMLENERAWEN